MKPIAGLTAAELTPADHWILGRIDTAIAAADTGLGPARPPGGGAWSDRDHKLGLRLDEYAESARAFVWNDLADWYLEHAKTRLTPGHAGATPRAPCSCTDSTRRCASCTP